MRVVEIAVAVCWAAVLACTTGSKSPPPDGEICGTAFTASGTFMINTALEPTGQVGCWPEGLWTIKVAKDTTVADSCAGSNEPTPLAMYQVMVTAAQDPTTGDAVFSYAYVPASTSDPNVDFAGKATGGAVGICDGAFLLYDTTGTKVWNLLPEINGDDMTLSGSADYTLYGSDQWSGSG